MRPDLKCNSITGGCHETVSFDIADVNFEMFFKQTFHSISLEMPKADAQPLTNH